jgi:predicted MPP superfamily phosphohydrolase
MRATVAVPLGLVGAGAAGVGYGWLEARWFALRHVSVPVLAPGADPLTILHLSDAHLTPSQGRKRDWLRGLADLEPDLVVSTGDHLAHHDAVPPLLESYGELLERPGVFVFGSNDVGSGWLDLNNTTGHLDVGGRTLAFAGVDDPHLELDDLDAIPPAAELGPDAELAVAVAHAPYLRVLDRASSQGYPLVLAGHTHGGQLCVPFYGALATNCDLDRRRVKGLSTHQAAGSEPSWLHVSGGLGTSPFAPVRFACRPEATLLTLTGVDSSRSSSR